MKNSNSSKKSLVEITNKSNALTCINDEKIADYISGCHDDEDSIEAYMSQNEENLDKIMTATMAARLQSERDKKRDGSSKHYSTGTDGSASGGTWEIEVPIWVLVLIVIVFFAAIAWAIFK